jgi:hypothetical protein
MSAFFNFQSLLLVVLLFICTCTYVKQQLNITAKNGMLGLVWKASRIGERLSPYVSICCVIMALDILFRG